MASRYEGVMCSVDGCGRGARKMGMCELHYRRTKKNGHPDVVRKPGPRPTHYGCMADGCSRPHSSGGYCNVHYLRIRNSGSLELVERPRVGSIDGGGYRLLGWKGHPLAVGQGQVRQHRAVLFDHIGHGPHPCHWCGAEVRWDLTWPRDRLALVVDHVNFDRQDNSLDNLVPSCQPCNFARSVERRRSTK